MATTMKLILFLLLSFYIFSLVVSSHQHHPLDPLTPSEFTLVRTIVNKSHPSTKHNVTFQYIGLDEPDKPVLLSWLSNPKSKPPPRRAFVITRLDKQSHEITVDLSTRSIVSDKIYHGHGYPLLTFDEQIVASELPQTYQPFLKSIKKRNLNLSDVVCSTFTVGWFGEVKSKRVVKLLCFYIDGSVNLYVRPLEGITLVVDLDEMKIVEYYDRFIVPVPKAKGTDYRASKQKPPFGSRLNGAALVQPDGPGFKIDGHTVRSVFSSSFFFFNVWTKQIYPMSFLFHVIFTLARFEIALINLRVALSGS
jgi:primary-amine oxidase